MKNKTKARFVISTPDLPGVGEISARLLKVWFSLIFLPQRGGISDFDEHLTLTVDLSQINPDAGGEYFQGSLSLDKCAVQVSPQ